MIFLPGFFTCMYVLMSMTHKIIEICFVFIDASVTVMLISQICRKTQLHILFRMHVWFCFIISKEEIHASFSRNFVYSSCNSM